MPNETIMKILNAHSIPNYEYHGNVYADSMLAGTKIFEKTVNMTGWGIKRLRDWLGY